MIGLMERHPGFPLQPVDRPALCLPGGGRPRPLRPHQGEGRVRPVGDRSAPCGSSPTPTCRRASPSPASSSTASATSRGPSAGATPSAGCPTASASPRRCRSSCARPGVDSFFTIKVNWNETNTIPHDLFWWEGLDGSRVLAHTFNNPVGGYNAEIGPQAIVETWRNYRGKHRHPREPARLRLRRRRRRPDRGDARPPAPVRRLPRRARAAPGRDRRLVRRGARGRRRRTRPAGLGRRNLPRASPRHPDHPGPHQVPAPPGRTGADHRRDPVQHGHPPRRARRRLPRGRTGGCSCATSSTTSCRARASARSTSAPKPSSPASSPRASASSPIASPPSPPASSRRATGPASSSSTRTSRRARSASPRPSRCRAARRSKAAACSPATTRSRASPPPSSSMPRRRLAWPSASARWRTRSCGSSSTPDGTLASVFDKRAGREALAGRGNQIWVYVDKPRNWDAWDIEESYAAQGEEIRAAAIEVIERGPHRAAIRIRRRFRDSEIVQTCRLWANSARLEFATDIDWHERRILLKARFPLAVRSDDRHLRMRARRDPRARRTATPPGTPRGSRSWRTASPTSPSRATAWRSSTTASTATTCSATSSASACCARRSIPTRSPTRAGRRFTYALLPHAGDWLTGGVLAEAEDLNQPLLCPPGLRRRPARLDGRRPLRASASASAASSRRGRQRADAADLRAGRRPRHGRGRRCPRAGASATRSNLLEEPLGPADARRSCRSRSAAGA